MGPPCFTLLGPPYESTVRRGLAVDELGSKPANIGPGRLVSQSGIP
ncbi:hypothetical protein JMJ77_0005652, partial [Colletotrichum scovillei]